MLGKQRKKSNMSLKQMKEKKIDSIKIRGKISEIKIGKIIEKNQGN